MNCRKCGNLLNENDTFCRVCGEAVNNEQVIGTQNVQQPMQQPVQSMQQPVQSVQQPAQSVQQPAQSVQQPQQFAQPMQQVNYGFQNPNMMAQNVMQPTPNKNNNTFVVIVIVLLVVIAGLCGFIGYKALSDNNSSSKEVDKKDKDTKEKDNDKDKDRDKEDEKTPVIADNKNIFETFGYKFTIPSELKYQIETGMLTISDNTTFQANFAVDYYKYEDVVANPQSVAEEIKSNGISIVTSAERKIGGRNFYLYQVQYSSGSAIFYLTKLDSYTSVMGVAMAKTTSGYEKCLEYVGEMVNSVDKTSSFAPGEEKEPHITIDNKIIENKEIESVEYSVQ